MTILPVGINKTLTIARETTFGVLSTASGQLMRRTNESMNLSIDSFINQEILPSAQYRDLRHGVNRPSGALSGNLAPGAYTELIENIIGRDYIAYTPASSTGTTISATYTAPTIVFTRTTGSFITDGHLIGTVVRCTGWTTTGATMNNANLIVIGVTALTLTVLTPTTGIGATKVAGDSVVITAVGSLTYIPPTGQVDNSFTLERDFTDASLVETFLGCKVNQLSLNIPASGFVSFSAMMMAQSMITGTASNFPTPVALNTEPGVDASTGLIEIGISGVPTGVINITGVQLQISHVIQPQAVVGSNTLPYLPRGRLSVTGQLTAYFVDPIYRNIFMNETITGITITATTSSAVNADFVSIHMPYVKFQSADKSDSDTAIFQTVNFQALENATGNAGGVPSTIMIQDSTATPA